MFVSLDDSRLILKHTIAILVCYNNLPFKKNKILVCYRIPFNMINHTRNFNGLMVTLILTFCKLLAITNLRASTLFFFYYYFSLFPSKICIPPCEKSPLFNIHENNSIFTPQLSAYLTTWPPIV